ncbi:uncharacterized protein LOC144875431 [Branchiostoma floridae x Branchiostoma japonicum]
MTSAFAPPQSVMLACLVLLVCLLPIADASLILPDSEVECSSSTFKCTTTDTCVPSAYTCDGFRDCPDGSDENCTACPLPGFIKCVSHDVDSCIPPGYQCDGFSHCSDGTDENDCSVCPFPDDIKCGTTSVCIRTSYGCDNYIDCPDGSDEVDCQDPGCGTNFECGTGDCIDSRLHCDGFPDCPDGSEEQNCTFPTCPLGMIECEDGLPFPCIHDALMSTCGITDCHEASDETAMNCISAHSHVQGWDFRECLPQEFECEASSICVPLSRVCDSINDCGDNSDESCGGRKHDNMLECVFGGFVCDSGMCVPPDRRCDGVEDCDDATDESGCECTSAEFQCTSSLVCVKPPQVCDGLAHCDDAADELLCKSCAYKGWECGSGECIDPSAVCDGDKDCSSGADEDNCYNTTTAFQPFECGGRSVPYSRFCDGRSDCRNGQDEMNCRTRGWLERSTEWAIDATGSVRPEVGVYNVLDGEHYTSWYPVFPGPWYIIFDLVVPYTLSKISITNDGGDFDTHDVTAFNFQMSASSNPFAWEDVAVVTDVETTDTPQEFEGFSVTSRFWKLLVTETGNGDSNDWQPRLREVGFFGQRIVCDEDQFYCLDGTCLSLALHCDSKTDCSGGEDEERCAGICNSLQLECDSRCLPKYRACDGFQDCSDGRDEENCVTSGCASKQFLCSDGTCLMESQLCDRQTDCSEGEDEDDCGDVPPPGYRLGLASRYIPDAFITASSEYKSDFAPFQARHSPPSTTGYCWVPSSTEDQWLQVYFGKTTDVTGVVISGGGSNWDLGSWVTSFTLAFSMDGASWTPYEGSSGSVQVFQGNRDRHNKVSRPLSHPVTSRYIRLYPKAYEGWVAVAMEVYVTNGL